MASAAKFSDAVCASKHCPDDESLHSDDFFEEDEEPVPEDHVPTPFFYVRDAAGETLKIEVPSEWYAEPKCDEAGADLTFIALKRACLRVLNERRAAEGDAMLGASPAAKPRKRSKSDVSDTSSVASLPARPEPADASPDTARDAGGERAKELEVEPPSEVKLFDYSNWGPTELWIIRVHAIWRADWISKGGDPYKVPPLDLSSVTGNEVGPVPEWKNTDFKNQYRFKNEGEEKLYEHKLAAEERTLNQVLITLADQRHWMCLEETGLEWAGIAELAVAAADTRKRAGEKAKQEGPARRTRAKQTIWAAYSRAFDIERAGEGMPQTVLHTYRRVHARSKKIQMTRETPEDFGDWKIPYAALEHFYGPDKVGPRQEVNHDRLPRFYDPGADVSCGCSVPVNKPTTEAVLGEAFMKKLPLPLSMVALVLDEKKGSSDSHSDSDSGSHPDSDSESDWWSFTGDRGFERESQAFWRRWLTPAGDEPAGPAQLRKYLEEHRGKERVPVTTEQVGWGFPVFSLVVGPARGSAIRRRSGAQLLGQSDDDAEEPAGGRTGSDNGYLRGVMEEQFRAVEHLNDDGTDVDGFFDDYEEHEGNPVSEAMDTCLACLHMLHEPAVSIPIFEAVPSVRRFYDATLLERFAALGLKDMVFWLVDLLQQTALLKDSSSTRSSVLRRHTGAAAALRAAVKFSSVDTRNALAIMKLLLEPIGDLDRAMPAWGESLLLYARMPSVVSFLLSRGESVNRGCAIAVPDCELERGRVCTGVTPLLRWCTARWSGSDDSVLTSMRLLLDAGASITGSARFAKCDPIRWHALNILCEYAEWSTPITARAVRMLITECGADVNGRHQSFAPWADVHSILAAHGLGKREHLAPLHWASQAWADWGPVVKELLACGADLELKCTAGRTALWHAVTTAKQDSPDVLSLLENSSHPAAVLAEAGADIGVVDTVRFAENETAIREQIKARLRALRDAKMAPMNDGSDLGGGALSGAAGA